MTYDEARALKAKEGEARLEALQDFNQRAEDWYVTCRHCGADLRGTLAQLKAHDCGKPDNTIGPA